MHLNKFDQEATKHVETPEWKLIEMHLMKTKHMCSTFGPTFLFYYFFLFFKRRRLYVRIYLLDAEMILKESIIIVCGFNLMAWKDSLAHTTSGDAKNKYIIIKKSNDIKNVGSNVERLWSEAYYGVDYRNT